MERTIPTIKVQSPSQVEKSITRRNQSKKLFNNDIYKNLNQIPQLLQTSPPYEFYDTNVSRSTSRTLFSTALDETPS